MMSLANGTRLGAYEIIGAIGAGGMGEVYRACDTRFERESKPSPAWIDRASVHSTTRAIGTRSIL